MHDQWLRERERERRGRRDNDESYHNDDRFTVISRSWLTGEAQSMSGCKSAADGGGLALLALGLPALSVLPPALAAAPNGDCSPNFPASLLMTFWTFGLFWYLAMLAGFLLTSWNAWATSGSWGRQFTHVIVSGWHFHPTPKFDSGIWKAHAFHCCIKSKLKPYRLQ